MLSSLVFEANIAGIGRNALAFRTHLSSLQCLYRIEGQAARKVQIMFSTLTARLRWRRKLQTGVIKKCFCIGLEAVTKMAVVTEVRAISQGPFYPLDKEHFHFASFTLIEIFSQILVSISLRKPDEESIFLFLYFVIQAIFP